tara:strand:- start:9388 stop:9897 length:510 start_codon:yes stop_codon:yes gene_type:complete
MLGQDGKKTDWKNMALAVMARGNALDAYFTFKIFKKLELELERLGMTNTYKHLLVPAVTLFKDMELDGMLIDRSRVNKLSKDLLANIVEKEDVLYKLKEVDNSYEMTSTDDITKVLFSADKSGNIIDGGFGLYPPITSDKTDNPSTSVEALDILLEQLEEEINSRGLDE